ncbi:MAG: L-threonine 3-dehydrogenase [Armatimonadota bacterium]|nr:L-threonine 3-dehydrogenase [Armatimonadota bacterium]MDR7427174.1 L-threonine 3-dehydrogenase [Armatimonadota bacterium]MDR7465408.1 L-threonine 3-dehydrogenase [Armatimonadota bacterium]MDR7473543.1 L-threonine 3-dehydrogenase [Armatimonadota bacterium]MDR7539978.1 L-threonine 3-dehydrogenase [Armatimonadota bacterium]
MARPAARQPDLLPNRPPTLPGRMRALVKPVPGPGLTLTTLPVPVPQAGEVLVRVAAGGICGTDLHIYRWNEWAASRVRPPRVVGHEFCGTVAAVAPGVSEVQVGDFVAGEGHVACGQCPACRRGDAHICDRLEIIGIDRDGAFADYVVLPARNAWRLDPATVPLEVAAVMDPLGNAVHTALATDPAGRRVAVIGCGPIGLMAIAVLRAAGAAFIAASDLRPERRALARQAGADLVLDAAGDVPARLREATGGEGVDVVLEMSGHPGGIRDALRALRGGGWISLLGLPSRPVEVDLTNDIIFKAVHLQGIFGRRLWQTWEQATALLQRGLDIRPLITHRFPLEAYQEAFALLEAGAAGKVVFVLAAQEEVKG